MIPNTDKPDKPNSCKRCGRDHAVDALIQEHLDELFDDDKPPANQGDDELRQKLAAIEHERYVIDKQIEVIKQVLTKKSYSEAHTMSVKKIEAELAELEKKAEDYAKVNA